VTGTVEAGVAISAVAAQDVPLEVFTQLERGDVLFVDTTHTVKAGSDVNRIVLDILPRLAPGVLVHIHDIFLPYEYPKAWLTSKRRFWSEQYLVQAFLTLNDQWAVRCASYALARAGDWAGTPSSLWIERQS
jgi:hypothetical protein